MRLAIIIVNWNGGEYVERCIRSISENPPSCDYEIIVVDNDSTDRSLSWLRSESASAENQDSPNPLRLIENSSNLGFSKANNRAISQTTADFLLLLNNDAEVTAGAID